MSRDFVSEARDLDSNFGDEDRLDPRSQGQRHERRERIATLANKSKASSSVFREEAARDEGRRIRMQYLSLNAYDRHKILVNEYLLCYAGASEKVLKRDETKDVTDMDVIRENHRFLWDESNKNLTWEQRLAKSYYDRLFKEYCICDLSRFKENRIGMRWRTKAEVESGKGQFVCGGKKCDESAKLRSWETDFSYVEENEKKNVLVKLRLCPGCSYKLNYHHKRKDVTKSKKSKRKHKRSKSKRREDQTSSDSESEDVKRLKVADKESEAAKQASEIWSAPVQIEQEKSRAEDFNEFLEDLFM